MKTRILVIIAILALGTAGWKAYETLYVAQEQPRTYYGNVDTRTVTLGFRFLGEIRSVLKDEGITVQRGYRTEEIRAQEARVASLEAKTDQLKRDLYDTTIYAPVDGVILSRFKEPGSIANPGEGVFEMARNDEFWVRAYVDEPLLGHVHPGQKMLIYTDSRKEPYAGHVGFIAPNAEFTPKTIQTEELRADLVYRFRVIIEQPDSAIRQGMPVTLKAAKE